ncbi:LacI family DNA-binding transcriptional regulator [Reyranella sp. CPCC 100927]|uniref:LacI family DNA-binding transcriptional regulator n=1 Tax=Reyranella sp. CPCC 100927 TaxID=2599616 RepID=UPI0011B3E7BF|nr:LacI family DNA-binding transcriptional regulator [Reyranella sp. CPCC 100927]TWS99417.1 LacI family DNA-binding transcriptional regulator [Reyranella sp. CPCC 100927]
MAGVTIRDVAQAAGVSLGSASRALNGGKHVSARVARDVAAAADRLGYQPDFLARSLRTRSSGMVGCLVSDVANPLYASIVQAAEARLRDAGYLLVVANTGNDPARERAAAAAFRGRRLDGILVAPGSNANDKTWRDLAAGGAPVVILDRDAPAEDGEVPWPSVLVDHRGGARAATRYLIGLGHRRIALLTPGARMRPGRERIDGFQAAFAEAGIDPAGAQVCVQESSMDFAHGDALALLGMASRPTALVALGTRILAGALRAARELRLSVPCDLSMLSIGDTDLAAVHAPAITALRWNLEEVGRAAAELLLQRLRQGPGSGPSRALLPVDLVLRESCAPPPTI